MSTCQRLNEELFYFSVVFQSTLVNGVSSFSRLKLLICRHNPLLLKSKAAYDVKLRKYLQSWSWVKVAAIFSDLTWLMWHV